jgi:hypothetical protein
MKKENAMQCSKWLVIGLAMLVLAGCGVTQATIEERNQVIGVRSATSNFFEAQQINQIENWKDDPGKIVMVYIINPATGGLLVPPIQCVGVPASSTESLEPNQGATSYGMTYGFEVPVDGYNIFSHELAGRDGTFGDPVPFRQCMGIDGNYHDWSMFMQVLVSSASYTFPEATVQRDFEAEARLLKAEEIIKRGGCVNYETLEEKECP